MLERARFEVDFSANPAQLERIDECKTIRRSYYPAFFKEPASRHSAIRDTI
jgi:hypothetical protein